MPIPRPPEPRADLEAAVAALAEQLRGRRVIALTGAGVSTRSGIPDYRGPGARPRPATAVTVQSFVGDRAARRRYWARSVVGWARMQRARPNPAHLALAQLEALGHACGVVTQNVDRLHQAAGSRRVVELHGALGEVECLACRAVEDRGHLQARLLRLNPGWDRRVATLGPDGDARLEDTGAFVEAACQRCGGVLRPRVVFFGETIPGATKRAAWSLFDAGEALLVAGTSLEVSSGRRFVREAARRGWPVGIVNLGPTRGDALATARVSGDVVGVLPALARRLA